MMTAREKKIAKAILDVLHGLDGGQTGELPLHAEANLMHECSLTEFNAALVICDQRGWLVGIKTEFHGKKWSLSDLGEAARYKL